MSKIIFFPFAALECHFNEFKATKFAKKGKTRPRVEKNIKRGLKRLTRGVRGWQEMEIDDPFCFFLQNNSFRKMQISVIRKVNSNALKRCKNFKLKDLV